MNQIAKFLVFPKMLYVDSGKNSKNDFIKYVKLHARLLFSKYFLAVELIQRHIH